MILHNVCLSHSGKDSKTILLYRFHLVVILINILATIVDLSADRYQNAWIDISVAVLLSLSALWLRRGAHVQATALFFLLVLSIALFTQIWLSHFGTMSVVFVLLLPLTTMLFVRLSVSLLIELMMIAIMALLLYAEYRNNPSNPIFQNPKALFHLAYAAAIIYIFGLLYHFSIFKTLEELDASNRQKELLLKEVHHRVKNNLNVIASIIGLQAASLDKNEKEQLLKSKVRIESIAMVHEMLYRSEDLNRIRFVEYMRRLSDLLLKMYSRKSDVVVEIESGIESLPLEVMVQLGIMTNELLTNSIKYAFWGSGGIIRIDLRDEGDSYLFCYEDDGRGVADTEQLFVGSSLGLKLIRLTAKQLGGDVDVSSSEGLKYTIRFKHG